MEGGRSVSSPVGPRPCARRHRPTPAEIGAEQTAASKQLGGSSGKVFTTAAWAVLEICADLATNGAVAVAAKGQQAALTAACATLAPYRAARAARVGSTANVEIVEPDT